MSSPQLLLPLRDSGFRALWRGQAFALLGAEFHLISLAWLALDLTGSGLALGSVLVVGLLPGIAFTLLGGVAADRLDFRLVMVIGNGLRAAVVISFAVLVARDAVHLWHLYLVGVVLGTITSFYQPAFYTSVPKLCAGELLRPANAIMRGTREAVGIAAPLSAGILVTAAGVDTAFYVTAGCYAVAAMALAGALRTAAGASGVGTASPVAGTSVLTSVRAGFAAVRQHPFLPRALVLISAVGLTLTGPITVGVPWLVKQRFDASAAEFGLMVSTWMVGAMAGAAAVGSARRLPGWRQLSVSVCAVLCLGLTTLGLAGNVVVAAAALLVMGAAAGTFNVLLLTWLHERTAPPVLGRVMSFVEVAELSTSPVSYLLVGVFIGISAPAVFAAAGVLLFASTLCVVAVRFPVGATGRQDDVEEVS